MSSPSSSTNLTAPLKKVPSNFRQLVVAQDDDIHFSLAHPKRLGFFVSPLVQESGHQEFGAGNINESKRHEDHYLDKGDPPLKQAHESSTIQLFYDLFFVANLTTFTSVSEINDADSKMPFIYRLKKYFSAHVTNSM